MSTNEQVPEHEQQAQRMYEVQTKYDAAFAAWHVEQSDENYKAMLAAHAEMQRTEHAMVRAEVERIQARESATNVGRSCVDCGKPCKRNEYGDMVCANDRCVLYQS
jgi:hypothetical protein